MKYREVVKKLRKLGCQEMERRSGGSHRKWYNPSTNKGTVLPNWGSKDIKQGTLQAVIKQLGIDWDIFIRRTVKPRPLGRGYKVQATELPSRESVADQYIAE